MGLKDGLKKSINRQIDKSKDQISKSINRTSDDIKRSVKNGIKPYKQKTNSIINTAKDIANMPSKAADTIKHTAQSTKQFANGLKDAEGVKGKAQYLGNATKNYLQKFDFANKIKNKATDTVAFIKKWYHQLIWVSSAVLSIYLIVNIVIGFISLSFVISPSPHYYCDTEASASLKKTAVYQQYCNDGKNFDLENLNGHYIIQDGSGPCTDCATANMLMRYYSTKDINFFDYLWDDNGQYTSVGQSISCSTATGTTNLRKVVNGNSSNSTSCTAKSIIPGTIKFAKEHNKGYWSMANWGYLRDASLDLAAYEETSNYYSSNAKNENWVFDLSVDNYGVGSTWSVIWEDTCIIDGIVCKRVTASGSSITGETIKSTLSDASVCGAAGVLVYYNYGSGKNHAVLITDYDGQFWYIIDSAKGIAGGYEGPMDGSNNFAIFESEVRALLDSGSNSCGRMSIVRICYVVN